MAMSISSAQIMMAQAVSVESAAVATRANQAVIPPGARTSVSTATPAVESPAEAPAPAPADSPAQFSTDREVDSQHQIYYKFVDDRTGDVVFEIPPEALREIGESLNLPLAGEASAHAFDVKS